jgi:iron-sulfur cluster assembly protein
MTMLTLTEVAKTKIKTHLQNRGKGQGIRIGVKTTGCSGLAYVLEFVDTPDSLDILVKQEDFNVYIDPKSSVYLTGITIDYQKQGLNEGFEFINPNEKDRCGCGESFRV